MITNTTHKIRAQIAFALALQIISIPIMLLLMMRARETIYHEEGTSPDWLFYH